MKATIQTFGFTTRRLNNRFQEISKNKLNNYQ